MERVSTLRLPCSSKDGVWLGELQLADRRGEASLEIDGATGRITIAELADYIVLLREVAPQVSGFASPISAGRVETDSELFGLLGSQAGLGLLRIALVDSKGEDIWWRRLWIRPAKFRDTDEFQTMVSDICDWRTSLVIDLRSSTSAPWVLDPQRSATPPEERLAVLRSAVERHGLIDALAHIERNATRRLEREANVARLGGAAIDAHRMAHHLATAGARVAIPPAHRLASRLSSLPAEMPATRR